MTLALDDPRHGTTNGYSNLGCHCDRCKAAWAKDHLNYMHSSPEQQEKARLRERARRERRRTTK